MDMKFPRRLVASAAAIAALGGFAVANPACALDDSTQQESSVAVQTESNTTAESARSVKVNQDIPDTIHEVNYSYCKWYKFTVPSNGYVQLNMRNSVTSESPRWDMTLYRENDTRNGIFSWKHEGSKNNESSQKYGLPGGTYYLRIDGSWAADISYTLKIIYAQRSDWEIEPNDTAGAANTVRPNGTIHGSFDSSYADDWYKFTLGEDGIVQLKFTNSILDSGHITAVLYKSGDMRNAIFDSSYRNDFDLTSTSHSSPKIGLSKGTYYVDMSSYSSFEYAMTVDFTSTDLWEKEPNNSSSQASDIALGKTYTGNITKSSDRDWYRFSLNKRQQVQIYFTNKAQLQKYGSWMLYVYSGNDINKELTRVENPCSQTSSSSKVLTLDKGSYYVQVDSSWLTSDTGEGSEYSLLVTDPAKSPSVTMYRLYNRYTGEHFYTSDVSERDRLVSVGWSYEGVGWVAPVSGDPVYRLYNGHVRGGDHHYTTSASERDSLVRAGWSYEGVGWRSGGSVPVYRQYNPYARTGTHNYTADGSENDRLVSVGWRAEGVGWYAVSAK